MTTCPDSSRSDAAAIRQRRPGRRAVGVGALLALAGHALAAETPPAPPETFDPLALESAPAAAEHDTVSSRSSIELAAGHAWRRHGLDDRSIGRVSLDSRLAWRPSRALRLAASARLDATDPEDERFKEPVLSLREAYAAWQDTQRGWVVEFGRINVREGPAYAYNPSDFFRSGTQRSITSADPASLRENRLGTFMLRGQKLWDKASLSIALAPRLADEPSDEGLAVDLGSTNARERLLAVLGWSATSELNLQVLLYRESGAEPQVGASVSALLSPAVSAHLEFSGGRARTLASAVGADGDDQRWRQRWVAGLAYTTAGRLTLTTEVHYNGHALDRSGWNALRSNAPEAVGPYVVGALSLQDNASRHAWFVHAIQRDLLMRGLDLALLAKVNHSDESRLAWAELRYRWTSVDVALQWQRQVGPRFSEFGIGPYGTTAGVTMSAYF